MQHLLNQPLYFYMYVYKIIHNYSDNHSCAKTEQPQRIASTPPAQITQRSTPTPTTQRSACKIRKFSSLLFCRSSSFALLFVHSELHSTLLSTSDSP
ncbi:uncharacterized protein DS421_12g370560 [Arachis hypogaea]|nr:uncharacterized protein DS421_12g370560 [Arachis hypogaea]